MPKLSALLIVYNEIKHLPQVINNLSFADEIIVVDSFSTDGTFETLQQDKRVVVFQKKFEDYASQRNFAISKANNKWILFLDADERITEALKEEILQIIQTDTPKSAYYFYRQFMYKNKPLRFSGLQTDKIYRLFQKNKAHYNPSKLVHENLEVIGEKGVLKHKLLHYFYDDYNTYKGKMIAYGKLKGKELFQQGERYSVAKRYLKAWYKFLTHYIIRLGILDGKKGLIISKLNALSVSERYKELKRLQSLSPK
ncbi:glycosyltransferase involved in cell wall biosynthesis [Ulvibacter sp. MAR_2010_11]|uniref:glycosyltransferase family 2 protein n=1 Tax=Ulvibacter sp. MAR_2010_11 TaxID=1250229 RepID=UPI000C2C515A|nr:glycosyltransferase family 2 protein [Ulvibacter sp. MAR_2010_11]PKA83759.1 glycosyltransferase involved in cell wall biosynthesis [Ulvibacter sp. MAR_2010_11]